MCAKWVIFRGKKISRILFKLQRQPSRVMVTIMPQLRSFFGRKRPGDENDDSPKFEQVLCKAKELQPGGKREFDVRGQPILVVNDEGNYRAVYGRCVHYKGKLVDGTFLNGKIRCPLHGACFDAASGDIEDFPGFDCLQTYETNVDKDGNLSIRATEMQLNRDRRPRPMPPVKSKDESKSPLIIVGAGPAGLTCAETLRYLDYPGPIIMFSDDKYAPYDRVQLSKIKSVCNKSKTVTIEGSIEPLKYSKLVLATGGRPRKLDVPGADLKGIFYLRRYDDARAIHDNVKGKTVVLIGTSFIAMEICSAIAEKAKSITLVGMTSEPMSNNFGEDVGRGIRQVYESNGVRVINKAKVKALIGGNNGQITHVQLENEKLDADMIIAAIGINPVTDFLKDSGIKMDNRGFVQVNDRFETNQEDIYAIGDIVTAPVPVLGVDSVNIQHWQLAQRHGGLSASYIANIKDHRPIVPFFWTRLLGEKGFRYSGCADGHDDTVTKGDPTNLQFVRYYLKGDRVVAVANSGTQQQAIQFLDLFMHGVHVNKADVMRNMDDDWSDLLKTLPRESK